MSRPNSLIENFRTVGTVREELLKSAKALLITGITTAGIFILARFAPYDLRQHGAGFYLIPVMLAATRWGIVPAIVAALSGAASAAYFLYDPIFSFYIVDPSEIVDLVRFILVAVVTGHLATSLRRQLDVSRAREVELENLNALSRKLTTSYSPQQIFEAIETYFVSVLRRRCVVVLPATGTAENASARVPEAVSAAASDWDRGSFGAGPAERSVIAQGNTWILRALSDKHPKFGVLAVEIGPTPGAMSDEVRTRIETAIAEGLATIDRLDMSRAVEEARLHSQTNQLRDALIGSVSHDLRTPLASIMGGASVLADAPAVLKDARLSALAKGVRDEAMRLNSDIQNLLDAARITSHGIEPRNEWSDPADIVNAAVARTALRYPDHRIVLKLADELPLLRTDPMLLEQALGQVIGNAAKFSSAGSTIRIAVANEDGRLVFEVADEGLGLTSDERPRIAERFYRSERHAAKIPGSGLGLWIANTFVESCGGRLEATSLGVGKGTTIRIALPLLADALQGEDQYDSALVRAADEI